MTSHDNVTDIVERLSYLHVWPQSIGSTYADTLTPRQIERLYDVGNVATEAADTIASLRKQLENAREQIVTLWHDSNAGNGSLHECLGMTLEEYAEWVNPDALKGQP